MKTFVLLCVTTIFAFSPSSVISQNSSIKIEKDSELTVDEVFDLIMEQTDYKFFYEEGLFNGFPKVPVKKGVIKTRKLLAKSLSNGNFETILSDNNTIFIKEKAVSNKKEAVQMQVTGTVTESTGGPLPGVSIIIVGTTNGTQTDFDGKYVLEASPGDVLEFSYIGFKTTQLTLTDNQRLDVVLAEELTALDEIVVVGFGAQKKVNLTGAVGVVKSEEFEARPVQNASQMLQGLVPGLNIESTGGGLENRASINIRGIATIGEGSTGAPLVLVDGIEGDLNAINPQDIESISVLKDAAASSIYGSRAPFGVILITTKRGAEGKPTFNYNSSVRVSAPINIPKFMDSYRYALFFNDAHINGGQAPFFSEERIQRILDFQNGLTEDEIIQNPNNPQIWADGYEHGQANNNWYDVLYKSSTFSQEHNISAKGGSEAIQYYISGNYLDQDGLMRFNTDTFERYAATIKLDARLTDWAKVSYSNRFIREDFVRPSRLTNGLYTNIGRRGWPMLPVYDPNGFLYSSPSPALGLAEGGQDKSQTDWLYQQGSLIINPVQNWTITGSINYRTRTNFRHWNILETYNHDVDGNPIPYSRGSAVHEEGFKENYINTTLLSDYTKDLGNGHFFKLLLGYQSELSKSRFLSGDRAGIIVTDFPTLDTTSGTDADGNVVPPSVAGSYNHWATQGVFGRINYNYKERYLLELNMRYDGTSRFRDDKRWNWFPSVSAGWNIAKEDFWEDMQKTISTFKFRGSYGELGNQNTQSLYPTYVTIPVGSANGDWLINGARPNTSSAPGLVSRSLTWERIKSWNAGLDLAFFNSRLSTSFDYFTRFTNDMVGPAPQLPDVLGTAVPRINNTDLKTYGFELSINWRDRLENGFGYNVNLLLSDSQTKVTKYPNETRDLGTFVEDRVLGEIWGYETEGIARFAGEIEAHLASLPNGGQDALGNQWDQGDIMYRDLNGDGKIDSGAFTEGDHGDLKVIGNTTPRYAFALDLGADYKGFDVRVLFQGVGKRDFFIGSYYFWGASRRGRWHSTGLEPHLDYYRADANHPLGQNLNSYYPRPVFSGKNHQTQTRYLQNAAYLRLKNLQIGYNLPDDVVEKLGLQKIRFFLSGENLWTETKLSSIFDPETVDDNSTGINYPLNRTISYGLNINF